MSMRLFFFLLVFANLLFFAWSQGHFGTMDENLEPERLAQQLQAEKLRILPGAPLAAAKAEAVACQVINGLGAAEAEAMQSAPAAAGTELKILAAAEPKVHLVAILDLANQAIAERKAAELGRFGVTEQETVTLEDGRREIILGRFETEAAANEFLQGLTRRGIKSARVDSREPTPPKLRVEARAPASILLRQLPLLIAPYAAATLTECAP